MFNNISPDNNTGHFDPEDGEMEQFNLEHINRLEIPTTLKIGEATFDDIAIQMIYRQRATSERTHKMLTYIGHKMETHNIDALHPDYQQFINYMDTREQIDNAPAAMLTYEWQIWQKILTAFGIPYGQGTQWNYKPPSIPPAKPRYIPLPDEMHKIIHTSYSNNKLKNAFIQYTILHSAIFGWRNPSELCLMKLSDIDLDNGKIIITEKKKHNKKRTLITDYPQILKNTQIKSLQNWIDIWRPRLETEHSKDYLYISPTDGRPLRQMQYTRYINYYVKPIYPYFQLYSTRHFNATGMLIREYQDTKHWNKNKIKHWLGHENENTTDTYIKYAEQYMKLAPYDWFKRVLKRRKSTKVEKSTLLYQITPITFGNFQTKTNTI